MKINTDVPAGIREEQLHKYLKTEISIVYSFSNYSPSNIFMFGNMSSIVFRYDVFIHTENKGFRVTSFCRNIYIYDACPSALQH